MQVCFRGWKGTVVGARDDEPPGSARLELPEGVRLLRPEDALLDAIEVDLTGQVCACSIGDRIYSGLGGQVDFMRGVKRCIRIRRADVESMALEPEN